MKKNILKLGILLCSIVLALLLSEILIRKLRPQITFSDANWYSFDCYANDSLLPLTLSKNHTCTMKGWSGEFNTKATINSLGYRGPEFTLSKLNGVKRILVLGDSITFGHGVGDGISYPSVLEQLLQEKGHPNIHVINAAYASGFSPDSYYLYLKSRGLALAPDMVIVGLFVFNDIPDLNETVWEKVDAKGLPEKITSCCRTVSDRRLHFKSQPVKYQFPVLRQSHAFLLLMDILEKRFQLFKPSPAIAPLHNPPPGCIFNPSCVDTFAPEEAKAHLVLQAIGALTRERNIPLLVVLLPFDMQLYPEMKGKYTLSAYPPDDNPDFIQKRLTEYLNKQSIQTLDIFPVFDRERSRGYPFIKLDGHFNALGHHLTAEAIARYLEENKML